MSDGMAYFDSYLAALRSAMSGCDLAVIQDAVNDSCEYLYHEMVRVQSADPELDAAAAAAQAMARFGAPEEVAAAFRQAVSHPEVVSVPGSGMEERRSIWDRIFGITTDIRAYYALLYFMLSMATGLLFGLWVIYGSVITLSLSIFIIGLPLILLFLGSVRGLTLLESRLIEGLLGMRMPRRPVFTPSAGNMLTRCLALIRDTRTWKSYLYHLLMAPLGMIYGILALTGVATVGMILVMPFAQLLAIAGLVPPMVQDEGPVFLAFLFLFPVGYAILLLWLHGARHLGMLHVRFARYMLVDRPATERDGPSAAP